MIEILPKTGKYIFVELYPDRRHPHTSTFGNLDKNLININTWNMQRKKYTFKEKIFFNIKFNNFNKNTNMNLGNQPKAYRKI